MICQGLHRHSHFQLCLDLSPDLATEGLKIRRCFLSGFMNKNERKVFQALASGGEEIQSAEQFSPLIPDDRDHPVPRKPLDRLEIGLAPIDLAIDMAMPPELEGRWVAPVAHEAAEKITEGLGVQLGVGVGDTLGENNEVLNEEPFGMRRNIPQTSDLGGTKLEQKFQPMEGPGLNKDARRIMTIELHSFLLLSRLSRKSPRQYHEAALPFNGDIFTPDSPSPGQTTAPCFRASAWSPRVAPPQKSNDIIRGPGQASPSEPWAPVYSVGLFSLPSDVEIVSPECFSVFEAKLKQN